MLRVDVPAAADPEAIAQFLTRAVEIATTLYHQRANQMTGARAESSRLAALFTDAVRSASTGNDVFGESESTPNWAIAASGTASTSPLSRPQRATQAWPSTPSRAEVENSRDRRTRTTTLSSTASRWKAKASNGCKERYGARKRSSATTGKPIPKLNCADKPSPGESKVCSGQCHPSRSCP